MSSKIQFESCVKKSNEFSILKEFVGIDQLIDLA